MKADLHVHSKHSDRPSEWFLRRIGAPECFTEPADLYRLCREKGMDFVTITDHNCIRGALEIAHLPGTFVSAELTTYFPEDGCKIHCLVYDLTEAQFADVQKLRENIYPLRDYLLAHEIPHAIAHPLFRINDRLTPEHVEKLLVLFNRFEAINGSRHPRAGNLAFSIFAALTPQHLAAMADRHGLQPVGDTPWLKRFTGGSDDHSGVHAADAFTATPDAATPAEFLAHLRAGRHAPGGSHGTSLRLAHSLYHIAYSYYHSRLARPGGGASVLGEVFRRFIEGAPESDAAKPPGKLRALGERLVRRHRLRKLSPAERLLAEEFSRLRGRNIPAVAPAPRGVDTTLFSPAKRDPAVWRHHGLNGNFKLLYVGRVSKEKNVGTLIEAFRTLRATRRDVDLAIVGEGPDYAELRGRHAGDGVVFTGFLRGEDLARVYAAADLFVFPSAIANLMQDPDRRGVMAGKALLTAREHTWDAALDCL